MGSRGKELPGNYNHILLSELFHVQSSRWQMIAECHLTRIREKISMFVEAVLQYLTNDEQVLAELLDFTSISLRQSSKTAMEELEKLRQDERQQPITYNHYYTDNVQNSRQESTRRLLRKAMDDTRAHDRNGKLHVSNNAPDAEKLLNSLQRRIIVNMDEQACTEALAGLSAYYKVGDYFLEIHLILIILGLDEDIRRQRMPAGNRASFTQTTPGHLLSRNRCSVLRCRATTHCRRITNAH